MAEYGYARIEDHLVEGVGTTHLVKCFSCSEDGTELTFEGVFFEREVAAKIAAAWNNRETRELIELAAHLTRPTQS